MTCVRGLPLSECARQFSPIVLQTLSPLLSLFHASAPCAPRGAMTAAVAAAEPAGLHASAAGGAVVVIGGGSSRSERATRPQAMLAHHRAARSVSHRGLPAHRFRSPVCRDRRCEEASCAAARCNSRYRSLRYHGAVAEAAPLARPRAFSSSTSGPPCVCRAPVATIAADYEPRAMGFGLVGRCIALIGISIGCVRVGGRA